MPNGYLDKIQARLWPSGSGANVWAILDCARDRRIYGSILNSYQNYCCLYAGALAPEIEVVAPHLVQLDRNDRLTNELLTAGWGSSWGIFLRCDTSMEKLRRHLRTLLTVKDEAGSRLLFRYYDPRVLRVYLPTCVTDELRAVCGPIDCFWMEGRSPDILLEFRFEQNRLIQNTVSLADMGQAAKSS